MFTQPSICSSILFLGVVSFSGSAFAGCQYGEPEMGDVGPSAEIVCAELEREYPNSNISISDRTIHSSNNVEVSAIIDQKIVTFDYHLLDMKWSTFRAPCIADL